jgi:hypothetical protein
MQEKAGDDGGDNYEMTLFVCNCPSWASGIPLK